MVQSDSDNVISLSDRISLDIDEDIIEFEPVRLNLEARTVEL